MKYKNIRILLIIIFVSFTGCIKEHRPEGLPPLVPTVLTVLDKDGKPLPDALVRLISVDAPLPFAIIGKTDSEGKTKISVNGQFIGAPIGKYRVLVLKNIGFDKTDGIPKPLPGTVVDVNAELIRYTNAVYGDEKKSPLEIEIAPVQTNKTAAATVQLTLLPADKVPPKK